MSEQDREERFDLARFVLGYLEHEDSLIALPAYGVYEVLMPDALASRLQVDPYLRLAFDAESEAGVLRLSVNHRLVETIAERLEQETGHAQVAINHVRLEKKGLYDVAAKAFSFPNARLSAKRAAVEQAALHHYLRFNFKVIFLGDEKQEQIVSVVMDVQGGYPVRDRTLLERLVSAETQLAFPELVVAQPRWRGAGDTLAPATLQALLLRAQAGAEVEVADRLAALQMRTQRFLELDVARIEDYYNSLERDLQHRLARPATAEGERRSSLESKIDSLRAERSAKLADIEARYQLRVELELDQHAAHRPAQGALSGGDRQSSRDHHPPGRVGSVGASSGTVGVRRVRPAWRGAPPVHPGPSGAPPLPGASVRRMQPRVLPVVRRSGGDVRGLRQARMPRQSSSVCGVWARHLCGASRALPRGRRRAGFVERPAGCRAT